MIEEVVVEAVALRRLRRDGGTQLRQSMDLNATREYAEAMQRGEKFPAVIVFNDGECLWLSDGFHRYDACVLCEVELIECEIREGTRQDAILWAAKANRSHGVRLTPADREKIIVTLVNEFPEAIQADIARMAGMEQSTVSRIMQRLGYEIHNSRGGPKRKEPEPEPEADPLGDILADLPDEEQEVFLPILTDPGVPEDLAREAAENLAAMPEEKRARVAEMAASPKLADRQAAVGVMRGQAYVHPAWSYVNVAIDYMNRGLSVVRDGEFEADFRAVIKELKALIEKVETCEREFEDESD